MAHSQVAELRQQIELELESMRRGLVGLASGSAKHTFISAKMGRVNLYREQLAQHIGDNQAIEFSCRAYIRVIEDTE